MKYKCVIFDCDGVLVDTEHISIGTLVSMGNELGAALDFEFAMVHFLGKSLEYCFRYIEARCTKPFPNDFEKQYRAVSFEKFKNELQPIEGIKELIEKLNVPFCVASNGPLNKMKLNLQTVGLDSAFGTNMFSAYDINKFKPDPALFLYAAETLGFTPEECVVIEDSDVGVKAAIAGGFDVFGFANPRSESLLKDAGANLFYHMNELSELLDL
ncbi:HAD family hydrolase [Flavicella marina]|uniref:HAD family hydrolase n=1 Tax=Flavicella marina TaxID=1475951 RepID=UPI00126543DD|nr:HAD family hydrolase [Flavicella marina]